MPDHKEDPREEINRIVFESSQKVSKKERRKKRNLPSRFAYRVAPIEIHKIVYEGYGLGYLQDPQKATLEPSSFADLLAGEKSKEDGSKKRRRRRRPYFTIEEPKEGALLPSPVSGEDLSKKTFFIAHTAPGDVVEATIQREKKGLAFGVAAKILEASSIREKAPCPVFGRCGGCQMQHLSYANEIRFKFEFVENFFHQLIAKKAEAAKAKLYPVMASPQRKAYRNHIQIKSNRERELGFFGRGNTQVVPLPEEGCLLLPDQMNAKLRSLPRENILPHHNIRVRQNRGNEIFVKGLKDEEKTYYFTDTVDDIRFQIKIDNFFQINRWQLEHWIYLILQLADLSGHEHVLDLFCGGGLITLPLAKRARLATGVEINSASIKDAQRTAELNGIQNARFISADALEGAREMEKADLIVVDPPRAGCGQELVNWIMDHGSAQLGARRLIYISCNPATFFRDTEWLLEKGAVLEKIHPVDMFPMTYHVELISSFRLPGKP